MILSPSTRFLVHLLAVLCISYRVVLSQPDDGLIRAIRAAEAVAAAPEDPPVPKTTMTTMETEATTDGSTTDPMTTTHVDNSTTEWIISTSEAPGNLSCVLSNNVCVLEGSATLCDPCFDVICDADKSCLADNSTCTTECLCTDELKTPNKDGVCINPCDPSPCQNKQPCVLNATLTSKFSCDCIPDYDGDFCENVHDYCKDAQPALCPTGARSCSFLGVGKYTCECAGGHVLDKEANTCTKVTQLLNTTLYFPKTLYAEAYNVEGTKERIAAIDSIGAAMNELYGNLLISIQYDNFTQGSLIAHYTMSMRTPSNGDPEQNVYDLMSYVTNCETNNPQKKACFGDTLGKPHLDVGAVVTEDLRCTDVYCPVNTECVPVDNKANPVRCSCMAGFTTKQTVVEDTGRQVDLCEDIDECVAGNTKCKAGDFCINTPGSFSCSGNPCDNNPCPGNAVCNPIKANNHYEYECQCDWIYIASDCGTPWPLILVIVSSVLLALLILAIIGLIILFTRSRKGSSVIDTTSF